MDSRTMTVARDFVDELIQFLRIRRYRRRRWVLAAKRMDAALAGLGGRCFVRHEVEREKDGVIVLNSNLSKHHIIQPITAISTISVFRHRSPSLFLSALFLSHTFCLVYIFLYLVFSLSQSSRG